MLILLFCFPILVIIILLLLLLLLFALVLDLCVKIMNINSLANEVNMRHSACFIGCNILP